MARRTKISEILEGFEGFDGIIEFPQNNTLYADQFTGLSPVSYEDREVFRAKNLNAVFEHYKPCKDNIVLITIDDKESKETIYFNGLEDFDIDRIIEHSSLLSSQKAEIENGNSKALKTFNQNLVRIKNAIHDLEVTYRSLDSFFANAGQGKVDCITLMNVNKEELGDHDSEDTLAIRDELEKYFDRLNLKNNYSMMVVPGYLGDADAVRMWAQTAYRNKVIMVTDFKDCMNFEMLKEELDDVSLRGTEPYFGNIVMTANYILGRKKSEIAGEDDDLYIPASGALAGRMSNTEDWTIAQVAVGSKYGELRGCQGTRMKLQNEEIASIISHGLIPVSEENGAVIALASRTLYNGTLFALHDYSLVRICDWIGKVFQNYCNDHAMEIWTPQIKSEISSDIHNFLSDYNGECGIIEDFNNINIIQNKKNITVSVEISFHGLNQHFVLEILGLNQDDIFEWKHNILCSDN